MTPNVSILAYFLVFFSCLCLHSCNHDVYVIFYFGFFFFFSIDIVKYPWNSSEIHTGSFDNIYIQEYYSSIYIFTFLFYKFIKVEFCTTNFSNIKQAVWWTMTDIRTHESHTIIIKLRSISITPRGFVTPHYNYPSPCKHWPIFYQCALSRILYERNPIRYTACLASVIQSDAFETHPRCYMYQ